MPRIHFLQQWYALSDPAVEEALCESAPMRRFAGNDLGREPVQDEAAVYKFRHLLKKHRLAEKQFKTVSQHLHKHSLATRAPRSTRRQSSIERVTDGEIFAHWRAYWSGVVPTARRKCRVR